MAADADRPGAVTPDDLTPAEREQAQEKIVQLYLARQTRTGGTRKGDLASAPLTQKMVEQRRVLRPCRRGF